MNDIQKHLIFMLQEIDEICTKNAIPYILSGRTARDAHMYQNFLGDYVYASVMMRGQDFDKFCSIVEKKPGRAIESVRNNPNFPGGMSMLYVDETTTFLYGDSAHRYMHKGIYITIHKCRNIPGNKYKAALANGIEKAISYVGVNDISSLSKKKQAAIKFMRLGVKVFGKRFTVNMLLKVQGTLVKKNSSNLAFIRNLKDNINLPATNFTRLKRVTFGGATFNIPAETDKYLEKVYGARWKADQTPETIPARHLLVASTEVSYKDIDSDGSLYAKRNSVEEMAETRKRLTQQIQTLRKKIEAYWDILFLTQERYRQYRLYMPVLDILREHYNNHDFTWLQIAMADYIDAVKTYLEKGWPLTVNPELDKIMLDTLTRSGEYAAAKRFENLKNQTSLKAIRMTLDEAAHNDALLNLPATIAYDRDGNVPVFLRSGDARYRVVRLDADGMEHPLLVKNENAVVPAAVGVEVIGEAGKKKVSAWNLAVELDGGRFAPLSGSQLEKKLFASEKAVALVQHIHGRDLEIAWLSYDGTVYVTCQFGDCDQYTPVSAPVYCQFNSALEVPVSFADENGTMHELFCVDDNGVREPVVKLGVGGVFWITANAGARLYYASKDGKTEKLDIRRYIDDANNDIKATLFREKIARECCKLVQTDVFGRVHEIAVLCDDESIRPVARMNADGTLAELPADSDACSVLCLQHSDGTTTALATIDPEGKVLSAISSQAVLPVGVIVTRPLTRSQMYEIGGSDGDISFHTTGYAL